MKTSRSPICRSPEPILPPCAGVRSAGTTKANAGALTGVEIKGSNLTPGQATRRLSADWDARGYRGPRNRSSPSTASPPVIAQSQ